jgi:ABC-type transport system involved in multi-copper enzyme maturation permease subunit
MATIAWSKDAMFEGQSTRAYASLGEAYFCALIGVELALVMFAAPAATAGAICLDRSRGTLAHILVTDLSDQEIVLGKLAARLLPVLGLVACTWPVLSITSLLGGIDPLALTMALAVIVAVAMLGCTMSLALSVWARKPHEVVLATYVFWIATMLVWPIWFSFFVRGSVSVLLRWVPATNPFYLALAPYVVPGRVGFVDYLGFFAVTLVASGIFAIVAVRRMRRVASRAASEKEPRLGWLGRLIRRLPGPSLDRDPVLWREWHRSRPSPWMMRLLLLVGGTTGIACLVGAAATWSKAVDFSGSNPAMSAGVYGYMLQLLFGLLVLSAVAPVSMSDERQRGSLDVLVATSLSTRAIVLGKWWGTFRVVPLLAIGPGVMALAMATGRKVPQPRPPGLPPIYFEQLSLGYRLLGAGLLVATILAHGAMYTSIGLALATWVKRQSRAIALSVGLFVLVAVGWPILVLALLRGGPNGRGPAALSPIFCAGNFADALTIRSLQFRAEIWWAAFWVTEVSLWAVGVLWLTHRTFDHCFGRIPDRPRPSPLLSDLTLLWAGTTAIACAAAALGIWRRGIATGAVSTSEYAAKATVAALLVIFDMLVLAVVAPVSVLMDQQQDAVDFPSSVPRSPRTIVLRRWWRAFRLTLLLAIGPGLLALALATAKEIVRSAPPPVYFPNHMIMALGSPLHQVGFLIFTILAQGAAMAGVALVLPIWTKRAGWAIAISVSLLALMQLMWPFTLVLLAGPARFIDRSILRPLTIVEAIYSNLNIRADQFPFVVWWAALYAILVTLIAVALLAFALRTAANGLEGKSGGARRRRIKGKREPSVLDPLFAGNGAP